MSCTTVLFFCFLLYVRFLLQKKIAALRAAFFHHKQISVQALCMKLAAGGKFLTFRLDFEQSLIVFTHFKTIFRFRMYPNLDSLREILDMSLENFRRM